MQQRVGVIDLGSNTTRLIVLGYTPHYAFKLLDEVREIVRLAEGIGADGRLAPAAMERGLKAMRLFHQFCDSTGVQRILPVATSAVREATNREEFLARVEREAGLRMRVISAEQEAYYGYLGAVNALSISNGFLIDIGGGSTQVTTIRNRAFAQAFSQPLGALRATDRYVRSDPIGNKDFKALEQAVAQQFATLTWQPAPEAALAGIGGTIRTLAEMDQKTRNYSLDRVHGYVYTLERLEQTIETLRGMTLKQREDLPGLSRDRADVILAGAVILRHLLRQGGFKSITVSGHGLREGVFYEHFLEGSGSALFPDMRGFSVLNLARLHDYEQIHCAKVQELALTLFDQLQPLHGYGTWERELLAHAATIHDIGVSVGYYDHHKHGAYLIINSALQGFSHRETAMMALLVRYHRKGDVSVEQYRDVLEPDDAQRVARLAALLRLAEFLERRKSQVIERLEIEIGASVQIVTQARGDASIEIWAANSRAGLFKKAFGREAVIV